MKKQPTNTLDYALKYGELGWSIIPIPYRTKKARIRWKTYQSERPQQRRIEEWFGNSRNQNLAVVLGPVSGDLACRDFDVVGDYEFWSAQYPHLAASLPTVKTADGYRVYFQGRVSGITHIAAPNGKKLSELRGSGGYCLLPPSIHPDGPEYQWITKPTNRNLPCIDPEVSGLIPARLQPTDVTERTDEDRGKHKKTKEIVFVRGVVEAIRKTLPLEFGTRHRKVFDFARALKSMPKYADADPTAFREIVRRWYKMALPNIRTKEFEETWIDFLKGWEKIKYKIGEGVLAEVLERARALPTPAMAMELYPGDKKILFLVRLCRELQASAGDDPFFLSARTAGRLVDVSAMMASRYFFLLESDHILKIVEKGGTAKNPRKATRYKYSLKD